MVNPKRKTIEIPNKDEAVVNATVDELKNEKKDIVATSSLDVLENQVDTTLTGEEAKKWLENLGTEVNIERVNKKLEAKEKILSIATQVDYFMSQKDVSIDTLSDEQGKLSIEAFNAYVWNNLLGSFYSALLRKCEKPDGTYDVTKFQNYLTQYNVSTITGLLDALKKSEAVLDTQEQKVVVFLQSWSTLAKSYADKEYPGVAALMAKNIPTIIANANVYFAAHPSAWKKFSDKLNNLGKRIVDDFKEHPYRNTILLVGWWFLAYKWIKRLFGKKKKKWEDGKSNDEKEGNHKLLKKVLLTVGVWGAARLLRNRYTKGKRWWTAPGDAPTQKDVDAFMKLDPEVVKKYTSMAEQVDNMYMLQRGDNNPEWLANDDDMFGESVYEKDWNVALKWVVPYVLSERYSDVNHFISEKALFTEIINGDVQTMISKARIWAWDKAQSIFQPILSKINGFTEFLWDWKRNTDKAFDFVRWNVNAQEAIRSMFRKVIKVMAYFKNREGDLKAVYVKEYLESKDIDWFKGKSENEQQALVEKYLNDATFYDANIAPVMKKSFYDASILQAFATLQEKWIEWAALDEDQKEALDNLQKMKTKYTEALSPLASLTSFDEKQKEQVKGLCDDLMHDMHSVWKRTYTQRFFSFVTSFTNSDENAMQQMMDGMDYDKLTQPYNEKLLAIQKKCDDGTLLASDVQDLHKIIDDYAVFQNDLINGAEKMQEIKGDNWSIGARIMYGFKIMWHDVTVAAESFNDAWKEWDVWKMIKSWVVLYPTGVAAVASLKIVSSALGADVPWIWKWVKIFWNWMTLPLRPFKPLARMVIRRNIGLIPTYVLSKEWLLKLYGVKNVDDLAKVLRIEFVSGRISQDKLLKLLQKYSIAWELNGLWDAAKLYKYIFNRDFTAAEVKILEKYLSNDIVRGQLCTKKVNRWIRNWYWTNKKLATTLTIEQESLDALMATDKSIQAISWTTDNAVYAKKVAERLMQSADHMWNAASMIEKIAANPDAIAATRSIISAERYGAILGKHASKLWETWIMDITSFIKKASEAKKILRAESFVINSIRNFEVIKAAGFNLDAKAVQELALNESKFSRMINAVGEWTKDAGSRLVRLKNALVKSPWWLTKAWEQTAKALNDIDVSKLPASCKAQIAAQKAGAQSLIQESQPVVASLEQNLASARQAALLDDVGKAAQLETKQLSLLAKIKSNKLLMKIIKFSPAITEVVTWIVWFVQSWDEVAQVNKFNEQRWEVIDTHRYFNLAISWAGATLMTIGLVNWWNPFGWAITAVAVGIEGVKYLGNRYYEVVESYYKNVVDFKREYMWTIKQELMSKSASGLNIDVSIQERFQENTALIGSVFGKTFTRWEKIKQLPLTLENATRALVYMEEMERFPLADMDKNMIDATTDEGKQLLQQIDEQKKWIDAAVNARFDYIVKQRPALKDSARPSLLTQDELKKWRALDQIDALLLASRKHVRLEGKSSAEFEKTELAELSKSEHDFNKFEVLWKTNKRDMQCAAYWLAIYEWQIDANKDTIAEYAILKEKIAYFKKYYNYKTYGLLQGDMPIPTEALQNLVPDTNMVEHLLKDGEIIPSTTTKEQIQQSLTWEQTIFDTPSNVAEAFDVSAILGQQIFYRIAKETMGYKWKNNLQDIKVFYTMGKDDTLWIYHLENSWYFNDNRAKDRKICDDKDLNNPKSFDKLMVLLKLTTQKHNNIVTDSWSWDTYINNEFSAKRMVIVEDEMLMRTPAKQGEVKANIIKFVQERCAWGYVALPAELTAQAIRAWFADLGSCQYTIEAGQLKAITLKALETQFPKAKTSLGCNVEFIDVLDQIIDKDIQVAVAEVDKGHTILTDMVFEKDSDFDFNDAIVSFVRQKSEEWQLIRKQVLVSGKRNQHLLEQMKSYQQTFENTYTTILAIATKWKSNDVDKTAHFELINQLQHSDLVTLSGEMTAVTCHCESLDLASEYTKKLQSLCSSSDYKVPWTTKTVFDLYRDTTTPNAKQIATRAANILLTCILEASMFRYDANGKVDEIYWWGKRGVNTETLKKQIAKRYTIANMNT
jgi:hypothetical protein